MRLNINFSGRRNVLPPGAIVFLLVAMLSCAAVAFEFFQVRDEYRGETATLSRSRRAAPPPATALSAREIESINKAIRQLNMPWAAIFSSLEKILGENVGLLALEPEAAGRTLRIDAEAKSSDDMIDFVRALRSEAAFVSARLVRHEINENDKNRPYRFSLEAQWAAGL